VANYSKNYAVVITLVVVAKAMVVVSSIFIKHFDKFYEMIEIYC